MSTIDIKKGDLIQQQKKGLARFLEWDDHNVMVFKPLAGGKEIRIPEHQFVTKLGLREIIRIDQDAEGKPIQIREYGPGEGWTDPADPAEAELTPEGKRDLALQFYTRKWDDEGGGLGNVGLQSLIDRWRPTVRNLGYETDEPRKTTKGEVKAPYRVQVAMLRDCIHNCGRPGERPLEAFRSNRGKNSARRCKDPVEDALKQAVYYFYGARIRTPKNAYSHLRDLIKDINRKRPEDQRFEYPRSEVLRRRIKKAMTYDNLARKTTPSEAWKKIHGHRRHIGAKRPLELAVMDSTPLDCFVLDSTTMMPLGKPHFTACLDVYSRMTLGWCVTFEPPSLYSVMLTLKRVNKNKQYVQKLFPDIKRPWDGWGRPIEILLDRDWSHQAPSFQHAMSNIGTDVHWAPANSPQYKGVGERYFRTINESVIHKLPGASIYNPYIMRQAGLDPKKDTFVTLDDLNELLHEANDVYIYDRHEGIGAVPARIWQEGLAIHRRPWIRDVAALDHILGRVDTATISGNGIKFKNQRWHDENVTSLLLDDLIRYEESRSQDQRTFGQARARVIVKWNPADPSGISVWNRGGEPHRHWVTMPNANPAALKGLTFWHLDRIREFAKAKDLEFSPEEDRWDAYDQLRKHWERLWGEMPMRESRQARRGIAWHLGQFDDTTVNDMPEITLDQIVDVEAEASTAGLNKVVTQDVPDQLAAELLDADNKPAKGRTPSKGTISRIKSTKARKKATKEQAEHEAYVRERRGNPTGDPHARGTAVGDDEAGDEGWGEDAVSPATAPNETTDGEFADDEGW